jgi:RNA polymerase sigma-70 factor (ECF subfamily)
MNPLLRLSRQLRSKLRRRGAPADDAEDLVQEAYLRFELYRREKTVRNPAAFVARTAMNLAIDASRRRRSGPFAPMTRDVLEIADARPDPAEVLAAQNRLDSLNAGLARLNERTRSILLAQRVEGLSYSEIARREGISVSAVEKQIARAMLFLAEWMQEP